MACRAIKEEQSVGRAGLFRGVSGAAVASASAGSAPLVLAPSAALAKSYEEAKTELLGFGVSNLIADKPPQNGWKVVVQAIGLAEDSDLARMKLGGERQVLYFHVPNLWIVTIPNLDFNGAAGTVQANDFGKGDSACLFVDVNFKGKLAEMTKMDFQDKMFKALTQKGKNFIELLKVTKVKDGDRPNTKIVEYEYEIESGAGFALNRNGIAAFTQVGKRGSLQTFWTGTTTPRWDYLKKDLEDIVQSFCIGNVPDSVEITLRKETKRQDELDYKADKSNYGGGESP